MRRTFTTMAAAIMFVSPATAQSMIAEGDIAGIMKKASDFGTATMEKSDIPMIRVETGGHPYAIKFLNCDGPAGCSDILLQTYLFDPRVDYELANSWNRDRRWTKVYFDDEDDVALEMDVDITGGIPEESLEVVLAIWTAAVNDFKTYFPAR